MEDKKKVLFVTQELEPYTSLSQIGEIARGLPETAQEQGMEVRILMPRYGTINERRHRLHEVVRLSGMNIIVDDDDYPLIIKVASLPGTRMQVYFLDNEDFFKRKSVFQDENGALYEDNPDRMVFFCKGVMETVKKFGWPPDIIHCHGWMTSLVPVYLKTAYRNEPLFSQAKIVYSAYEQQADQPFDESFLQKASINNLSPDDLLAYQKEKAISLHRGAIRFADGVILDNELAESLSDALEAEEDKPVLRFEASEPDYLSACIDFYDQLSAEGVEK